MIMFNFLVINNPIMYTGNKKEEVKKKIKKFQKK